MPYIKQKRRKAMLADEPPQNAGEFNYCLTWHILNTPLWDLKVAIDREIEAYLSVRPKSYAVYNEVVGALECCRREFIRRRGTNTRDDLDREGVLGAALNHLYDERIAPYEDTKIKENGDVY